MGPVGQGVLYEPWLTKEQGSSQKASQRTYYWRGRGGAVHDLFDQSPIARRE